MCTFNFLTCKSIFDLSELHKLQPWWDIQVCEKIKFMERWKPNGSIEILGGLNINSGMKINQYETEKSHIALWSNLSKLLHVKKWYKIHIGVDFISVSISNSTPDMSCSVYVFSTGLMTHFSDFFSYLLITFCHFAFTMGLFPTVSNNWLEKSRSKQFADILQNRCS